MVMPPFNSGLSVPRISAPVPSLLNWFKVLIWPAPPKVIGKVWLAVMLPGESEPTREMFV